MRDSGARSVLRPWVLLVRHGRRAERRVAMLLQDAKDFNGEVLRYLNRLSDLYWLLERYTEQNIGTKSA